MIRFLLCLSIASPAIASLAFVATARAADFVSGSQLAQACASTAPAGRFSCDGYIAGVLDTVSGSAALEGKMCTPPTVKLSALREALARFGQQHADETRGSGVAFLYAMMKATYPCPAK